MTGIYHGNKQFSSHMTKIHYFNLIFSYLGIPHQCGRYKSYSCSNCKFAGRFFHEHTTGKEAINSWTSTHSYRIGERHLVRCAMLAGVITSSVAVEFYD